jgi:hypothetical protein
LIKSAVRRRAMVLSQAAYERYAAEMFAAIEGGQLAPADIEAWQPAAGGNDSTGGAHAVEGF